jgi:chlorite dismutase
MSDTVYALYVCFKATRGFRDLDLDDAAQEVENLFKEWDHSVTVRGVYSTVGFRADTDLMALVRRADRRRGAGCARRVPANAGGARARPGVDVHGRGQAGRVHPRPRAGLRQGRGPRRYLCAYPFVRTPEWYLLPSDERASLLREHGEAGREFPEVLANTTSAFGINDWEWILAFEADELDRIVDCIRRLRERRPDGSPRWRSRS